MKGGLSFYCEPKSIRLRLRNKIVRAFEFGVELLHEQGIEEEGS